MSCCCDTHPLLGALMGDLVGKPVHKGAPFSLGVEFQDWYLDTSFYDLPEMLNLIKIAIDQSGYVSGLTKVYWLAGQFDPFIVVEGYSGREYGSDAHLRDAVLSVVQSKYQNINYGSVRFEVVTYDPQTKQQQTTRYDAPRGGSAGNAPPPDPNKKSLWEEIAEELDTTKDTAQALVFGGGALLLVLLMKR